MGTVRFDIEGERVEMRAHIVGGLAIHRPVYRYMRGQPLTYLKTGWSVTHIATGGGLNPHTPKGPRGECLSLTALKEWAARAQALDVEGWAELNALPFGPPPANRPLAARILSTLVAARA